MSGTVDIRQSASKRGYDTQWKKLRQWHIQNEPLCRHCRERGITRAAEEVDHILSVNSRPDLRLDPSNLQSLCRSCHVRKTRQDNGGETKHEALIRVVTGPPGVGKTQYIKQRSIRGELIWDLDAVAGSIGFPSYPRPNDVMLLLGKWWKCLTRQLEAEAMSRDVWLIVSKQSTAAELAQRLSAELIDLTPIDVRR